jgi:hypothetical protein
VKIEARPRLSATEHLFFWLRRLGSLLIVAAGAAWLIFVDHDGFLGIFVGCVIIGVGLGLLIVAGPTDAEKRGYHF